MQNLFRWHERDPSTQQWPQWPPDQVAPGCALVVALADCMAGRASACLFSSLPGNSVC